MIPKVIHYCWLSDDPLPEKISKCIQSWSKFCPDYEIINWNFQRLGDKCPIWVHQAFASKKYAFAADWIRAYVLYTHGGIYLDSDVEVVKSFNPLINNRYMLSYEHDSDITLEAAVMGAEAGLNFFKELLAYYEGREFILKDGSLDTFPLPYIINSICESRFKIIPIKNPAEQTNEDSAETELKVLPAEYFSPKSTTTGKINRTENTFTIHHFEASWMPRSRRYKRIINQKHPKFMRFLVVIKHLINGTRPI